ncbi:MAG: DUF4375 domain-containing protein [Phycisphaeraceae bacterium]|nr:DUF4375 domain-containing protein [Phycisphaerales bacterium]MCB9859490.1 DUF4375 domain-containing protein [Phycisphaeraceae bacterium]
MLVSSLGVVLAVIVAAVLWCRLSKRADRSNKRFQDYVRNPREWAKLTKQQVAREELLSQLEDAPTERLIDMLLDDNTHRLARKAINSAGPRMYPALVDALSDPRFHTPVDPEVRGRSHILDKRSMPLVSLLECLEQYLPPEAIPVVSTLVRHKDDEVRKHAAFVLGSAGNDNVVDALRVSLADEDDYVRSYAMMGMIRALKASRTTSRYRKDLYKAVESLVYRRDKTVSGEAPLCLLGLDRERAIEFLTNPENLTLGKNGLEYVLKALRMCDATVPETLLLKFAIELEKDIATYPNDYVMSEVLLLLANIDSDAAREVIAHAGHSPSARVQEFGMMAQLQRHGITNPYHPAFDRLDALGWDGVSQPERHVLAVRICIDQIENGGFTQYFFNSAGDNWPDAVAGFEAMGNITDYALLAEAAKMFGAAEPSTDRDERQQQLAKVIRKNEETFSPLDRAFYEDKGSRELLLLRYIAKHAEHFGPR